MREEVSLTPEDVAGILKITRNTVYELIKRGELPGYRVGRKIRVDLKDVEAYKKQGKIHAASSRSRHVFIPVNCGALPKNLIVSGGPVRVSTERAPAKAVRGPVLAHGAGGSCSSVPLTIKGLHNFLEHYSSIHTALEGVGHEELAELLKLARRLKERILFKMSGKGPGLAPLPTLEEVEMSAIAEALDYHQGKIINAARSLGIGRNTLARKIKAYQLKMREGCGASRWPVQDDT